MCFQIFKFFIIWLLLSQLYQTIKAWKHQHKKNFFSKFSDIYNLREVEQSCFQKTDQVLQAKYLLNIIYDNYMKA